MIVNKKSMECVTDVVRVSDVTDMVRVSDFSSNSE